MTRFELIEQELASLKNTVQLDTAAPQWGEIAGTLSAQVDLNAAIIAAKARANHTGIQSADTVVDGTNNKAFTATEKTKLAGVAAGATANSSDTALLARANHTGTQSADTIIDGTANKVYTAVEQTKLAGIAAGATVNSSDATLLARANHTGTQAASTITEDATHRFATDTEKTTWNAKQAALVSGTNIKTINGVSVLGSGDIPGEQIVVATANVTNSTTSYADFASLAFPVVAGNTYWFEFEIYYTSSAETTGSRWSINGPLGGTVVRYRSEWTLDANARTYNEAATAYDFPAAANAGSLAAGKGNMAIIRGTIVPGSSGNVVARFASEVAASNITALGGVSTVRYRQLN